MTYLYTSDLAASLGLTVSVSMYSDEYLSGAIKIVVPRGSLPKDEDDP